MRLMTLSVASLLWMTAQRAHADCAAVEAATKISIDAVSKRALGVLKTSLGKKELQQYELVGLVFDTEGEVWRMIFRDRGPSYLLDNDPHVWIDDRTARTCFARGLSPGNCLEMMYPPPKSLAKAKDVYCKFDRPRQ